MGLPALCTVCNAQENLSEIQDRLIESRTLLGTENEQNDDLSGMIPKKININNASFEDLNQFGLLSPFKITAILNHIDKYGALLTLEELQSVSDLALEDIRMIRHIAYAGGSGNAVPIAGAINTLRHELYLKWGLKTSEENDYLGNNGYYYLRYRAASFNKFSMGLQMEKDAGEPFHPLYNKHLFDFTSGYLRWQYTDGVLRTLLIGDYSVSMGQGLIMHNAFNSGKSTRVNGLVRSGPGLSPYSSVDENGYFRGAALSLQLGKNTKGVVFISKSSKDARKIVDNDSSGMAYPVFSSFSQSGYHRTVSEWETKDAIAQKAMGATISFNHNSLKLGFNAVAQHYNGQIKSQERLYNIHRFAGNFLLQTGIDLSARADNFYFFGELAHSQTGGFAVLMGMVSSFSKGFQFGVLARNYQPEYISLNSNAFGESSSSQNERGVTWTCQYNLGQQWNISAYLDTWKHPWLKYRISRPSQGADFGFRCEYQVNDGLVVYLQYAQNHKERDISVSEEKYSVVRKSIREKIRLHMSHQIGEGIELRTRLDVVRIHIPKQYGYIVYQDVLFKPMNKPLSFTTRLALYSTDGYDSRLYAYENALLNESLIPSYTGSGMRYYINIRFKWTEGVVIEGRWARTFTHIDEPIRSTHKEKTGTRSELRCQLKISF